jgi:hypothetical protein
MLASVNEEWILHIDAHRWLQPEIDLMEIDREVHRVEDLAGRTQVRLVVEGSPGARAAATEQIVLRYQRLRPSCNRHTMGEPFRTLRARHRALHALDKPLVRADYDHTVDVWQWILRLDPDASLALQVAALFHDVERLSSEADARVEHAAPDYLGFKHAHAKRGAMIARSALQDLPLPPNCLERVEQLVSNHEQPGDDRELCLLNDADALSFFALNSPGFVRYFDADHSAKKVRYSLRRMSRAARSWLPRVRLETRVAELLAAAQRAEAQA